MRKLTPNHQDFVNHIWTQHSKTGRILIRFRFKREAMGLIRQF